MRGIDTPAAAARIAAALLIAFWSASCSSSTSSPSSPSPPNGSVAVEPASISTIEQQTHAKVNAYRASVGLPALAWNDAIAGIARRHSSDMASGAAAFGHDGFTGRVGAIAQSVAVANASENVAMASGFADPVGAVVQGWLDSPTHKPNIEGDFALTGVGAAISASGAVYFTQIFVKPR